MRIVLAHGSFDCLHIGHIKYLEKAKSFGDYLIVMISSDNLIKKCGKANFFNEQIRKEVVESLKCVDKVIITNTLINEKIIKENNVSIFATIYKTEISKNIENYCEVKYLKRMEGFSSTSIREYIKNNC